MTKPKQDEILDELKRRAEQTRFGEMTVCFKVHEGKITAGEIIEERIKLG